MKGERKERSRLGGTVGFGLLVLQSHSVVILPPQHLTLWMSLLTVCEGRGKHCCCCCDMTKHMGERGCSLPLMHSGVSVECSYAVQENRQHQVQKVVGAQPGVVGDIGTQYGSR